MGEYARRSQSDPEIEDAGLVPATVRWHVDYSRKNKYSCIRSVTDLLMSRITWRKTC